jgi:hypothetical protein
MNTVFVSATVASMDAGAEPTRTYSLRVVMVNSCPTRGKMPGKPHHSTTLVIQQKVNGTAVSRFLVSGSFRNILGINT